MEQVPPQLPGGPQRAWPHEAAGRALDRLPRSPYRPHPPVRCTWAHQARLLCHGARPRQEACISMSFSSGVLTPGPHSPRQTARPKASQFLEPVCWPGHSPCIHKPTDPGPSPSPTATGISHPRPATLCPNHPEPTAQSPAAVIPLASPQPAGCLSLPFP